MAAIVPPSEFLTLLVRLKAVRRRWLAGCAALALWRAAGLAGLALGGLVLAEILLRPSVSVRVILVYGVTLPGLLLFTLWMLGRALRGMDLRAAARRVQAAHPQMGCQLEGALDLYGAQASAPLVRAALEQVAARAGSCDFTAAARIAILRRQVLPTAVVALLLLAGAGLYPGRATNAWARLFAPRETQAIVGAVTILAVEPGRDVELVEGADLTVRVTVDDPACVREAVLEIGAQARRLSRVDERVFAYTLRQVRESLRYRLTLGGSSSRVYEVAVVPRPAVTAVGGRVIPPAYTGLAPFPLSGKDGAVTAPAGSRVLLEVQTNHAIREGHARLSSGMAAPLLLKDGALQGEFDVKASGTYTISLLDERGHTNENPVPRPVECVPDALPRLRLAKPSGNQRLGLGESLEVLVDARDDYGLQEVGLYFRRNQRGEPQLLKRWRLAGGQAREVQLPFAWTLAAPTFDVGDVIALYAEGTDFGPGEGRVGRSAALQVTIVNREKIARRDTQALEKVRRQLAQFLEAEKRVHAATAALVPEVADAAARAARLRQEQVALRLGVIDAAGFLANVDDAVARRIRMVLLGLGANELATAVAALESVAAAGTDADRRAGVVRALPVQAEVIKRLTQILGILPALEEKVQGPPPEEKGTDLPPDAAVALQKLKDGLGKFQEDQKKVVEATQDLAKTNVDDFTEEDRKRLEDLRATEENWAKFLKDMHSDLSKLPKQDFSNSSLLGEVLAVLEEVELAEGAMTKKEVEIATEAATTGMELAESLTTHLEKWLPDQPDRVAWAMEEPLKDYEVPMAELPEKLEDIVGELTEQEEDLMEEIEDQSSSWADSIDKGAGWDAMDGPISNYSAQGVTGNQLPNDSEIGGRSGEGRQGKSNGEMVGDTAVGKDGRKTPSRLTPDAYEQGEIKDESKDSSGGATGGGKSGAAGAEGLEGPPPPPEKGPMPRLLGKQAELRNKAERLNLNLKLMGYNTAVLENTLAEMRSVEQELKSGRYQTAARRAHYTVEALRTTQDAVLGEAAVRADRAAGLPRELQREIMDALDAGLPKGYEDLVKAYYERLAQGE